MKTRHAVLVALAAAVALVSVASAGSDGTKQRVAITARILPGGEAVLTPLKDGALKRDSGRFDGEWSSTPERTVMLKGQEIGIHPAVWTLKGKRGTLTIRERTEWVDIGIDGNEDGLDDGVAFGTWKVVRGTGQYARIAGGGRSGHAGLGHEWNARYEGFLSLP